MRPNYLVFIGYLKMGGREGGSLEPPLVSPLPYHSQVDILVRAIPGKCPWGIECNFFLGLQLRNLNQLKGTAKEQRNIPEEFQPPPPLPSQ